MKITAKNLSKQAVLSYTVLCMAIIKLTKGFSCVVDDADFEQLSQHRWCVMGPVNGGYYAIRRVQNVIVSMARFLTGALKGQVVDHINGDSLDNRRSNLRLLRQGDNIRNAKLSKRNKSGATGVCWNAKKGHFVVSTYLNGRSRYIGSAHDVETGRQMHCEYLEKRLKKNYYTEIFPKQYAT